VVDNNFWFILDFLPGFYAARFILYVWMFYPRSNNGATVIYNKLKPYLVEVKKTIDQTWNDLQKKSA
jgi:hypothetical protein